MYSTRKKIIKKLDQLIDTNLMNGNYSIEEICLEFGISRSQLFRILKEEAGLSPTLYIRKIRLQKGKELLDTTSLRIAEIAYRIGMDSPQSFTKYFTETYGLSPGQYRKNRQTDVPLSTEEADEILPEEPLEALPHPLIRQSSRNKTQLLVGTGALIGLLLALGVFLFVIPFPNTYSLAVIPFKNVGNKTADYFSEGVTDQIHNSLVVLKDLKVISKNSSMLYANTGKKTQTIGAELGVSHLISGTVWQLGTKIRITVQLIEVATDRTVWSNSYDGQTNDLFSFISMISKRVANALEQNLTGAQTTRLERVPTRNLDAYHAYVQGKYLVSTRSKEKLEASLLKFDEAIALDPDFADAYTQKAEAYISLGNLNHISLDSSFKLGEKNALSAIRLDPQHGLAYGLLAHIYSDQYKWEQANTTFQIALKHSPNNAHVRYWYSLMLRSLGMLEEATQFSTEAVELDPLSPVIMAGHIRNCSYSDNQKLLKEALHKGELYFSNSFLFYLTIAYHHLHKQQFAEALADFQRTYALNPSLVSCQAGIAFCQARLGNVTPAKAYIGSLAPTPNHLKFQATAYAGLKDEENCLRTLEAMANRNELPNDVKVSPVFKFLHTSPRFQAILQKFNMLHPTIQVF